jgi:ABC-type Fe3+/spermidine/putrescine transport system ATPase subunit
MCVGPASGERQQVVKGDGAERRPFLRLENLTKRFDQTTAVDDVSVSLDRGEMLALLGPSGSGKTTTLRLLAGFEVPDAGRVLVENDDVTAVEPVRRRFGMVFQHYALFPHLDVGENVAFGLESLGVRGDALNDRVARALALVDLAGYERRRVGQLSGGQQQRVALARALAPEPRVLLLDEPLSNLDPALRERTRREIRELIRRLGITTVFVTHEQDEAFDLGDRVALLRAGRLEQVGTPEDLYALPSNAFVAEFIGRSTSIGVTVIGPGERGLRVALEQVEWDLTEGLTPGVTQGPALMVVRPEALRLTQPGAGAIPGRITERRFTGSASLYAVLTAGGTTLEVSGPPRSVSIGDQVGIMPSRRAGGGIHLFPAVPA